MQNDIYQLSLIKLFIKLLHWAASGINSTKQASWDLHHLNIPKYASNCPTKIYNRTQSKIEGVFVSFFLLQTFCLIKELNWGLQPWNQVPRKLQTFVDLFKKEQNSEGYLFSFYSFFKMSKSWGLHWPEGYCTTPL